jgi:hypothetical protein
VSALLCIIIINIIQLYQTSDESEHAEAASSSKYFRKSSHVTQRQKANHHIFKRLLESWLVLKIAIFKRLQNLLLKKIRIPKLLNIVG